MIDVANERVSPMPKLPHLGELIRESMDALGGDSTEPVAQHDHEHGTLSRMLNGRAGTSGSSVCAGVF